MSRRQRDCGLLIRGGMVADGTGAALFRADVRIRDGVIAEVGAGLDGDGEAVLDAGGAIVAPGFIDSHTHLDPVLFWDPVARGCADPLPDAAALARTCSAAVRDAGFDIVAEAAYAFTPHGASVALLLAQSHIVVSTWPEFSAVLVDLAVCGTRDASLKVWASLEGVLLPSASEVIEHVLDLEPVFQTRRCAPEQEPR